MVKVRGWLGDRTRSLHNVRRLNIMFGLMRAELGGHTDPALYPRLIREELERARGRPKLDWRAHHYVGQVRGAQTNPIGSLFRLSDDARGVAEAGRRSYWVSAQASSLARKAAALNDYHFVVGAPLVQLTTAKTPSVILRKRYVSDFPTYLDDWDPANPGRPYTTTAGHDKEVG
jgi:hypothetical protein